MNWRMFARTIGAWLALAVGSWLILIAGLLFFTRVILPMWS